MNTRMTSRVSWMFVATMLMCPVISGAQEEAPDALDAASTEAVAPASMSDAMRPMNESGIYLPSSFASNRFSG